MPVKRTDSEALFRQMASDYAEREGAELLREKAELERTVTEFPTPALDRRVLGHIRAGRRRRYFQGFALAAACVALMFAIPRLMGLEDSGTASQPPAASDAAAAESAQAPAESSVEAAPSYEMIPLSFTLPENLSVSAVEQDRGQTIYHLDDTRLDNVVMTLEYAADSEDPDPFGALRPLEIGGATAYGESTADYSLLRF